MFDATAVIEKNEVLLYSMIKKGKGMDHDSQTQK